MYMHIHDKNMHTHIYIYYNNVFQQNRGQKIVVLQVHFYLTQ